MSKHSLALALGLLGVGCSSGDDEGLHCAPGVRPSVRVTVVDADGAAVDDAVVTYSLEGMPPLVCRAMGDGVLVCGLEDQGRFVINGVRGDEVGVVRVDVRADVCHVITENVTLTIEPPT
jgi:hypothetical protein